MTARQHRAQTRALRGAWLAFLALAMQVLVPFFMAVEIARAEVPGAAAVICAALGHETHQGNGDADHGLADHCSICTTLAAAQGFAPPSAPPLPPPATVDRTILAGADIPQAALLVTLSYQSRGPPSVA